MRFFVDIPVSHNCQGKISKPFEKGIHNIQQVGLQYTIPLQFNDSILFYLKFITSLTFRLILSELGDILDKYYLQLVVFPDLEWSLFYYS